MEDLDIFENCFVGDWCLLCESSKARNLARNFRALSANTTQLPLPHSLPHPTHRLISKLSIQTLKKSNFRRYTKNAKRIQFCKWHSLHSTITSSTNERRWCIAQRLPRIYRVLTHLLCKQ
mmetsp:Transcript_4482/g.16936  ORF Transcript_4482/g.16936 Transcript_4482/m.16936 type:complete len:120 (-) Transcript_4482:193-552(-)